MGDDTWSKLDKKTQDAVETSFTDVKGKQGKVFLKQLIERAGLDAPLKGTEYQRRVIAKVSDGTERTRHFDEITVDDIKPALFGLIIRRTKDGSGVGFEVKVGSSKLHKNQKKTDDAIKGGTLGESALSKAATARNLKLPKHIGAVHQLRVPIDALPRDELVQAMEQALKQKGIPTGVIGEFVQRYDVALGLNRNLRAAGRDDLANQITIANSVGILDEFDDE